MQDNYRLEKITTDENGEVISTNVCTFTAETLTDLLDNMTYFVAGCSFTYVAQLEAVNHSEMTRAPANEEQYSFNLGPAFYDTDDLDVFASA
jgi:hypothetical protein